jgi:ribosome maturation factor RimP
MVGSQLEAHFSFMSADAPVARRESYLMSARDDIVSQARRVAEPIIAAEGLELVDVEWAKEGPRWILRLFIDRAEGVSLDDCQACSHAVETAIDVEDFIPHEYTLEVSSPGLNRPLTRPAHYEKAIGKKVQIKTYGPIGDPPRKNFSGLLVGLEGPAENPAPEGAEAVAVEVEGAGRFRIPFKDIAKAHLEFDFGSPSQSHKR